MAADRKPSTDVIVGCESLSLEVEEEPQSHENKGQELIPHYSEDDASSILHLPLSSLNV
jgi:hypothetical protein